jgi:hypothetical protein
VKELLLFQKVVNVDEVVKPLEWWKENEVQFPIVGFLDQQLLAIHGFQIKTKCIYNVDCILISLRQCKLGTFNLDSFIMIYTNWHKKMYKIFYNKGQSYRWP